MAGVVASAAAMRPDVVAGELAGVVAVVAVVWTVGGGREEPAGFWLLFPAKREQKSPPWLSTRFEQEAKLVSLPS